MAIFGGLSEISLPDVMSLIGKSTGSLVIEQKYEERTDRFELYLDARMITRMSINHGEIQSMAQARSFIIELVRSSWGDFRFYRGTSGTANFSIPVNEILLSSLSMVEEMEACRRHFPEPHTIFTVAKNEAGYLDAETRAFWLLAEPHFKRGASAQDLFDHLGFYLDQILFRCHQLRLAGAITPQRAYFKQADVNEALSIGGTKIEPVLDAPVRTPVEIEMEDLSRNLKPIWNEPAVATESPGESETFSTGTTATVNLPVARVVAAKPVPAQAEAYKLRTVETHRPSKGFMGGFMQSLKSLMGGRR